MENTLSTSLWKLILRPQWEGELDEDCATACRPGGVGALQLSAYQKDNGAVTDDDLLEFASESVPTDTLAQPVRLGAFSGLSYRYLEGATVWRRWFLRAGRTLLFVTYNCDQGAADVETDDVDLTLHSLQAL